MCAARRVAQLALLQRQLVQALGAARLICKDSGLAVSWRHEYESQVKHSRFTRMHGFEKIRRSLQLAMERSRRARASRAKTLDVTCLRGLASYTTNIALAVWEQHVRHGGFVPTAVQISFIKADIAAACKGKRRAADAERHGKEQAAATSSC